MSIRGRSSEDLRSAQHINKQGIFLKPSLQSIVKITPPHPRVPYCPESFNTYFRRMMTALLSLMSCGRIQCVISSAAYPLTTKTKSRGEKDDRQEGKAVARLSSTLWPAISQLPPQIPPPNTTPFPRHTGAGFAERAW